MIKRTLIFSIALITAALSCSAQLQENADDAFQQGNYYRAVKLYSQLLADHPNDAEYHLRLGLSYLNSNRAPQKAAPHLEKAVQTKGIDPAYQLDLARAYMYRYDYEKAERTVNKFLKQASGKRKDEAEKILRNCHTATELMGFPIEVSINNAGGNVNSQYPDYNGFIDRQEQRLVFTTRRKTQLTPEREFDGHYASGIMMAQKESKGFAEAVSAGSAVNTPYDEQVVGRTLNGDSIFVYLDHIDSYGDLYLSPFKSRKFQRPQKIEGKINSGYLEAGATLSSNGNTIIFSSNRGKGEDFDLYMARRLPDDTWGKIQPISDKINSPKDERFPNFSADGTTLYFSTNNRGGMGGMDIFFADWEPVSNTWSRPQNLGYPLNTPGDDRSISFTRNQEHAYVSMRRKEGYGDLDIYRVTFKERTTDPAIFQVNLAASDSSSTALAPEINIKNKQDELIGRYNASRYNNKYIFALYPGRYYVSIDAPGFAPYNEMMIVNDYNTRQKRNLKEITLQKAQ